ncbi:hypothetical protein O181_034017 [Austropuccinia psidii MF-1]|uniref:Uncharacterized protein n=1 Tax=Austropuccinia psidii MF-1 TaxID=1389203 RepID=A0A9Q3D2G3_9BASI|nr:hypothetical protein [Austropuccinia psidii MF-1]
MLTLLQPPIDMFHPATPCHQSTIFMLPHDHLILSAAYHAYAPSRPYRYASPSIILMLPHALSFSPPFTMLMHLQPPIYMSPTPSSFSLLLTMIKLPKHPEHMTLPPQPNRYASAPLPNALCHLPCLLCLQHPNTTCPLSPLNALLQPCKISTTPAAPYRSESSSATPSLCIHTPASSSPPLTILMLLQ